MKSASKGFFLETCSDPASEPLWVEQSIPGYTSLIPEPVQGDSRGYARAHEARRAMQLEGDRWKNGCGTKQLWMMFDGDIKAAERVRELKERWENENGMVVGEVRLMAEGRVLGWDGLANLADGTIVQVSGNICSGMGKPRKKKEKNPWESDGSGSSFLVRW